MDGDRPDLPSKPPLDSADQEHDLAEQIDHLKEQRVALDEELADMTHRLRELSHMEEAVQTDQDDQDS